jgi:hypothetical protein
MGYVSRFSRGRVFLAVTEVLRAKAGGGHGSSSKSGMCDGRTTLK